ncbi:MAG: S6e family ribosomal protein [Candidatus Pacearchaeota archaeon]
MAFKINIGTSEGKTYNFSTESNALEGKELKQTVKGEEIDSSLQGYEFQIAGASDASGFPAHENVEGMGLKKVLMGYGKGMRRRPKYEENKKRSDYTPKGLRLRKTVRGRIISSAISQVDLKVTKQGDKTLKEIFEQPAEGSGEGQEQEAATQ